MPGVLRYRTFEKLEQENVVTEYIVGIPSGEVIDVTSDEFARLRKARVIRYDQQKKMFRFLDANYSSVKKVIFNSPDRLAHIDYVMDALKIKRYKINENLVVDVDYHVDLTNRKMTKIPVKFGTVTGNFDCQFNNLTNLTNSPHHIGGYFDCSGNEIYTLIGGPDYVAGGYYCNDNNLETLDGFPTYCEVTFTAERNKLNSLIGCPQKVTCRNFDVSFNHLRTLKGGPRTTNDFDVSHNSLTTLVGGPEEVKGTFNCTYNKLFNLLGMPAHHRIIYDEGNKIEEIDNDYY